MMQRGFIMAAFAMPLGVQASPLEVVVAHFNENLGWLSQLAEKPRISVYTKGSEPVDGLDADAELHQLPNVGREAHSYLSHIVNNYDKLADWSVFTQAGEPSFGYRGHKEGGGHLIAGDSFANYLIPDPSGARFVHTSAVHLPSMNHVLRAAYCINDKKVENSTIAKCPKEASKWTSWWDMGPLREFMESKIASQAGEQPLDFYRKYINQGHQDNEVTIPFAQGARFAVSKEKILQRPKEDYERLLAALSRDVDPYAGYFMEWMWSELFLGHQDSCQTPPQPAASPMSHNQALMELAKRYQQDNKQFAARFLQATVSGCVSGVCGTISGTTPAPEPSSASGQQAGFALLVALAMTLLA